MAISAESSNFARANSGFSRYFIVGIPAKAGRPNDGWGTRLVAVTRDGKERAGPDDITGESRTVIFGDLPLSSISYFCYQVRPFARIEFSGIALQPRDGKEKAEKAAVSETAPASANHSDSTAKPKGPDKAQAARIEALRKAYEIVKAQHSHGGADILDVTAALNALLEAQLDTAATKAERIAILEAMLANRRDAERVVEGRYKAGTCVETEYDRAQADRLEAEIRLNKEKGGAGAGSPSSETKRDNEKLRKLQDERIVSLAKAFRGIDAQYRAATANLAQRIAASDALLEAQLDSAEMKPARIAILEKLLENRRDLEKYTKAAYNSGTCRGS